MSLTSLSALASVPGFVKGNPSIDYYKVLGFSPELVADFDDEYYRANRQKTTFDGLLTHSRLSNATMVDSDGLIKWGPHNLLKHSEEFNNASWGTIDGASVVANAAAAPDGSLTADELTVTGNQSRIEQLAITGIRQHSFSVWLKSPSGSQGITLRSSATVLDNVTVTEEWQLFTHTFEDLDGSAYIGILSSDANPKTVYLWGAHLYRSDLGGMVNNPDTGNSYVPTTSSARYLPRRGHHVYNGSAWVNEGLLIETESRTNLLHTTNALVTQTLTVTAVPHTLHFTGTGTVTLSGASTDGPLVGTGTGEQNRVSLTFTPTAGLLMLIVTGTVADAQLEVGSTPSSYIPNLAASGTVTRAADTLTIPSAKLPWPTPKVIGPELVTNGTFDTDVSGWTAFNAVISSVSGRLEVDDSANAGSDSQAYQEITTVAGRTYTVALNYESIAPHQVRLRVHNGAGPAVAPLIAEKIFSSGTSGSGLLSFTAASTTTTIGLVVDGTGTGYFDNISVREIDPLAVSIQMDGRVTFADTNVASSVDGGVGEAVFSLWKSSSSNYIESVLDTDNGTGMASFIQEASGTRDPVSSTGSYFTPGTLVPYNIASRHGSTFINGAVDGTALTADNTPVALPNLSSTDLSLAYDYMGTIRQFRVWAADLGDSGIEEASTNA